MKVLSKIILYISLFAIPVFAPDDQGFKLTQTLELSSLLPNSTSNHAEDKSLLVMEKKNLLGLQLSLPPSYQKPISNTLSTETILDKILNDPGTIIDENYEIRYPTIDGDIEGKYGPQEDIINKYPLRFFEVCDCMPQDVYTNFTKKVVDQAIILYKQKDAKKPFVYGSFASGELFPDLCILTNLVYKLRSQKIENIHLRVNLIDTDLQDYILKHSRGIGRTSLASNLGKQPIHSHMLSFKPTSRLDFSNADDASELIIHFLQWFTQNLKIKLDLYIYGTALEYVYDHEQKRVPSHDMLVAIDYDNEAAEDLAQLAIRTIRLNGYLCSLSGLADKNLMKTEEEFSEELHLKTLTSDIPIAYKEPAALAKKEAEEETFNKYFATEEEETKEDFSDEPQEDLASASTDSEIDIFNEPDAAYIIISKKTANISAEAFKDLLRRARGDRKKIGKLFNPLFYVQSKFRTFQSQKIQRALNFDPLNYFKIEYSTKIYWHY